MTNKERTILLNFRIPVDLKERFHENCRMLRSRMSTELIRLINEHLKENLEINSSTRHTTNKTETGMAFKTKYDINTGLKISD